MGLVWVVVGEVLYEKSEVVSVWASEESARAAAGDDKRPDGGRYDYVTVECHEVKHETPTNDN